jgi:hypothetical protein
MIEQRPALPGFQLIRSAGLSVCLVVSLALTPASVMPAAAQRMPSGPHGPFQQPTGQRSGGGLDDLGDNEPVDAARRLRALNEMRQKSIVSDTNKLLQLANELNAEIGDANSEALTPGQLHKLATIEKLAHSVKDKMSTPIVGVPAYRLPPPPMMR